MTYYMVCWKMKPFVAESTSPLSLSGTTPSVANRSALNAIALRPRPRDPAPVDAILSKQIKPSLASSTYHRLGNVHKRTSCGGE